MDSAAAPPVDRQRFVGAAGAAILFLWLLPVALFAAAPACGGDLPCGPGFALVLLGPPALVYLVALAIWVVARRVLLLIVMTAVAAAASVAIASTEYVVDEMRPVEGIALLAPFVFVGGVPALREHRLERWLSVALLVVASGGFLALGVPLAAAAIGLGVAAIVLDARSER